MQAFECQGYWWLPGAEAAQVAGTLRVSSSGELRLSVLDALGDRDGLMGGKEHPIILGSTDSPHGSEVTLAGCYVRSMQEGTFKNTREEYRAQRGYFGACLADPAEFSFRRVVLRIGGLGSWALSLSGFRPGGGTENRLDEDPPLLRYARRVPVSGMIPDAEIAVGFEFNSSSTWHKYAFTEIPVLMATFDRPLLEEEINKNFVYPLQNLMTLIFDKPQEIEEMRLWREDVLAPTPDNPRIRFIAERVFTTTHDDKDKAAEKLPHPLFTLADLEDGFAPFMERWLRMSADYADACNHFFGLQYGPPAYLDLAFLGVAESLSLFYTRRADGVARRDEERKNLADILGKLAPQDADWVRGHIADRPFPPFRNILAKLLHENAEAMVPLLQAGQQAFIDDVATTIDYVVRRDPENRSAASHGTKMYLLVAKLRILLRLCFLQELGFTREKARSFFENNPHYQHFAKA